MGDPKRVAPVQNSSTGGAIAPSAIERFAAEQSVVVQPVVGQPVVGQPVAEQSVVELRPGVQAETHLPPQCHSALRAGFAGYSPNPRWSHAKLQAWRLGKQWRNDLAQGDRVVVNSVLRALRDTEESLGTAATHLPEKPPENPDPYPAESGGIWQTLLGWSRKKTALG